MFGKKKNSVPVVVDFDKKAADSLEKSTEDISFAEYQEQKRAERNAKRNKAILVSLSILLYLLGLAIFASPTIYIYNINEYAGYIVGGVLLLIYSICFIVMLAQIYSHHAFELEGGLLTHQSESKNNKLRFEIARNLADQAAIVNYVDKKADASRLFKKDKENLDAYSEILVLAKRYPHGAPNKHSKDAKALAKDLKIAFSAGGFIEKKGKAMMIRNAAETGTMTALSEKGYADAGIVVVKIIQLLRNLIWLYGFRPSDKQLNSIMLRAVKNACVAIGLNQVSSGVGKFVGSLFKNVPVGSIIGTVVDAGGQLVGNGLLTYMFGRNIVNIMMKEFHLAEVLRLEDMSAMTEPISNQELMEVNAEIAAEQKVVAETVKAK